MSDFEAVRFGKYQLIEKIATGGMAEVYKAKSYGVAGFEKLLVIKKILPHLSRNPDFVAMFINEAKIAVSMNHANIVQVYDLGKVTSDYYMAMEFIHGQDLMRLIKHGRKTRRYLPIPTGVYIITEVARGLDYAHSLCDPGGRILNVVHQDISPHNILISYEGDVKVVDFGIARVGEVVEEEAGKLAGGKFAYMAPEQATGGVIDHRSDIFALSIVLYELATGQRLYAGKDRHEKMRMVRGAEIPPPRAVNPEIPLRLEEILLKGLAKDPERRYQRARDLQEDLLSFLYDVGMRVTRADLAQFMKEMFAEEYARTSVGSVVNAIVRDLSELADQPGATLPDIQPVDEKPEPEKENKATSTGEWEVGDMSLGLGSGPELSVVQGERRQVEVMAIEVTGLTDAAERIGEEQLLRLNYSFLKSLAGVVANYKGTISRTDADRLLVFWGLQRNTSKDLELCLRCASDLRRLSEKFAESKGERVHLSLGIHRGTVLVAGPNSRRGKERSYTPWGDTVKLARRLCEAAGLDEVLVSDRVMGLVGEWGELDEMAELPVKWAAARVRPWRLRRLRGRGERGPAGRWIKRGAEFEVLKEVIGRVAGGKGVVLCVEGEAGAGKARFLREIREITRDRRIAFYSGKGYFYRREVPFLPFREILEAICGFEEEDANEVRCQKMLRLAELRVDPIDIHIIGELFELEFPNSNLKYLSGDQKRIGTFEAMRKVFSGLCSDNFLVLALENFQYLDHYSVDLATYLMRTLPDRKLLLVLTQPKDEQVPFSPETEVVRLVLPSMGRTEVGDFARELLGVEEVPEDIVDRIVELSGGNALFAREIVVQLRRQGLLGIVDGKPRLQGDLAEAGIPATIEDLISSRIDSLGPTERIVLEVAATTGRNFDRALLGEVVRLPLDELNEVLTRLQALKLVRQAREEEGEVDFDYTFRNQLTWEVTTRGILTARSKDFHTRVAEATERLFAENLRPHFEELSRHYQAGGLLARAAHFSEQSGIAYDRSYFNREAQRCFQRAILLLRGSEGDDGESREVQVHLSGLQVRVGEVQFRAGSAEEAERTFTRALDHATAAEDGPGECKALIRLGQVQMEGKKYDQAGKTLRRAQQLADSLEDESLRTDADEEMATWALQQGDFDSARIALNRALATARGRDDKTRIARILGTLGAYYLKAGDAPLAERTLQKAREMAMGTEDKVIQGQLLNNLGLAYIRMDRFAEALACYRESCEIRRSIENRRGVVLNLHNIGDVYFRMGDYARAYQYFEESRESAREHDWEGGIAMNQVYLGYLQSLRGELEEGQAALELGISVADRVGDPESVSQGRVFLARLLTRRGEMDRAREVLAANDAANPRR